MSDFQIMSANDGTHYIRPITAKAEVFWKQNNLFKYVIDNTNDFYVIKSIDSQVICDKIRQNDMDFAT